MRYVIGILALIVVIAGGTYVWRMQDATVANATPTTPTTSAAPASAVILPADASNMQVQADAALIAGKWQSTDDPKYTLSFDATGNTTDTYAGTPATVSTSTWKFYTKDSADSSALAYTPSADTVYIQKADAGGTYHYGIVDISPTALTLVYLDRGGTLNFTRAKAQ